MSARPGLDAVVFDAGGTLVRLDFEWMAEDLAAHGFAIDAAALRACEVQGRRAYDASARPAGASGPGVARVRGDVRAYFRGTLEAAGLPPAMVAPVVERFLERERTRGLWCRPMEGARAALDGVRALGLRTAVVSNSDGRAEIHLANAEMLLGIEFVVDSHLVGIEKPDPAIFAVALARLGTAAERTLFVGDIRSVDEAGAAAAGMRFVLLDPTGAYAAPGSPHVAGMHELAAWVDARFEAPAMLRSLAVAGDGRRLGRRPAMIETRPALARVHLPGLTPWRQGKVRDIYEVGADHLIIVASDRLSAYDSILPTPIPGKGRVLTALSVFWFGTLKSAAPHHFLTDDPRRYPPPFDRHGDLLAGRSMLVRRAERIDIECVVRGHLTGSGWGEYRAGGAVCGIALPPGLSDGSRLEPPIFTPATKADAGHDQNIAFGEVVASVGRETAEALRARSLAIYEEARAWAWDCGLVLADTKFEFGRVDGAITLIDEILSPDSSRYWDRAEYEAGRLLSFDKQLVRNWLDRSGWNHEPPAPALPDDVVARTGERYAEAMRRLTGAPS